MQRIPQNAALEDLGEYMLKNLGRLHWNIVGAPQQALQFSQITL